MHKNFGNNEGKIIADGKGREVIKDTETLRKASLTQPPVVEIAKSSGNQCFFSKRTCENADIQKY